jgi:predicted Ser/Thr protein kinase
VKIGRYEVETEIGRGAMGVVYLAVDPRLERRVAIKTYSLPDGLAPGQRREFQERFLREARAAAGLSHPGIVTVFDSDEDEATGNPFIAMEYVAGRTLRDWMDADGRLPAERAFEIAGILAGALHSAHAAGIVHRDIKPGNVLVGDDDREIKITDFGIARLQTSELTRTGMTLGSPAYMSPEQITRGSVDARSDLFSLAVILYEMLCGERPFGGDELAGLAYSIVHEQPMPISKKTAGLPLPMDEFFERALAKEPQGRFADGREFAAALSAAANAPVRFHPGAPPPSPVALPREDEEWAPRPGAYPADEDAPAAWEESGRRAISRRWPIALIVVVLLAGLVWAWRGRARVELEGTSSVRSGTLTLTVDGRRVYTRELSAEGPRRARLLRKAVGIKEESFNASIGVRPGKHEIVASLESDEGQTRHQQRVVVDMGRGEQRTLRLSAGSAYGAPLSLKLD